MQIYFWQSSQGLQCDYLFSCFLENSRSARGLSSAAGAPDEGPDAAADSAAPASVFSSGRRITRSQQGASSAAAKKYPLRQSRSSGSDTEANGETEALCDDLSIVTCCCGAAADLPSAPRGLNIAVNDAIRGKDAEEKLWLKKKWEINLQHHRKLLRTWKWEPGASAFHRADVVKPVCNHRVFLIIQTSQRMILLLCYVRRVREKLSEFLCSLYMTVSLKMASFKSFEMFSWIIGTIVECFITFSKVRSLYLLSLLCFYHTVNQKVICCDLTDFYLYNWHESGFIWSSGVCKHWKMELILSIVDINDSGW